MNRLSALTLHQTADHWLAAGHPALIVHVAEVKGSTPRETDARMLVGPGGEEVIGTIGGGHLEWQAIALARQSLQEGKGRPGTGWQQTFALGPTLGQCCGGVVVLRFEPLTPESLAAWPVPTPRFHLDLHGAGHVGQAIVRLLWSIDVSVRWIDQRLDETQGRESPGLPTGDERLALPPHIHCLSTDDASAEPPDAPPGSAHLVLTHRHDLDLRIVDAILRRDDVRQGQAWVGLIGSRTKRAAFEHRLQARGHGSKVIQAMACPIGLPGIMGKEPGVIAVAVVAQLLLLHPER
ncbi:MAG: xanthine dehydrogenase accessory protein XdhC [Rubrivivax sp.]|nr:MAG: xanthine dehydrogenase accessory protein XdhC [Rubrivivax sp.]